MCCIKVNVGFSWKLPRSVQHFENERLKYLVGQISLPPVLFVLHVHKTLHQRVALPWFHTHTHAQTWKSNSRAWPFDGVMNENKWLRKDQHPNENKCGRNREKVESVYNYSPCSVLKIKLESFPDLLKMNIRMRQKKWTHARKCSAKLPQRGIKSVCNIKVKQPVSSHTSFASAAEVIFTFPSTCFQNEPNKNRRDLLERASYPSPCNTHSSRLSPHCLPCAERSA